MQVLQTVLKRELTFEEAMAIAQDMVSGGTLCVRADFLTYCITHPSRLNSSLKGYQRRWSIQLIRIAAVGRQQYHYQTG